MKCPKIAVAVFCCITALMNVPALYAAAADTNETEEVPFIPPDDETDTPDDDTDTSDDDTDTSDDDTDTTDDDTEPTEKLQGWVTKNGRLYYYDADGKAVVGEQEIDGIPYLFAKNGALKTGWQTVGGVRRYYDKETGKPAESFLQWRDETYYLTAEHGKQIGLLDNIDGKSYFFDDCGIMMRDALISLSDGSFVYADSEGVLAVNQFKTIDSLTYYFGEDCKTCVGWKEIDGNTYYFDSNGSVRHNFLMLDNHVYFFDENAVMQTGFVKIDNTTRYFDKSGIMQTGLTKIDKKTYYFDENGIMQTGITQVGKDTYYLDKDGVVQTGFIKQDDGTHYFNASGIMQKGIVTVGENTYYFNDKGVMQTGIIKIGEDTYYFDENGIMQTNVLYEDTEADILSYFDENGKRFSGIAEINGVTYYFNQDGVPYTGLFSAGGKRYYANANGQLQSGWKEISGAGYYFKPKTFDMAVSTTIGDFTIEADGKAYSSVAVQTKKLLANATLTPGGLFDITLNTFRYKRYEATRTREELNLAGWDSLVAYMFKNKAGLCYNLAACLDYFMQRSGFTTRIVHATHSTGDHYWNQVLVNGKWHNYDPTYRARKDIAWNDIIKLGSYSVYGYVYVHYDARGAYVDADFEAYTGKEKVK